jgi:hypothetical protein
MSRPTFAIFAQQYLAALLYDYGTVFLNEPIPRNPKLRVFKMPSRTNFSTETLKQLTRGNDRIMVSPEVVGEAELVDILFEPSPASRESLGLLGEILVAPCIIHNFRWAPNVWDIRNCLGNWLKWSVEDSGQIIPVDEEPVQEEELDDFEDDEDYEEEPIKKALIIIVPSINPQICKGFGAKSSKFKISGVYETPSGFGTTIIVTSEFPCNDSTLWLRLLGRGLTQRSAIQELMNLEVSNPHRTVALEHLHQWHNLLVSGHMGRESKYLMQTLANIFNT